ncbi:MAG TPA: tRNA (adenosine(37)-N6)-threonylcarbamoyltransferase complex ATPase subunit type 1 TsaE [Clostridiales bacterium]|nr:tRNA (adenosine(37)-N6)-threonylcarbamoyltransferase complex ATPase subunit type 1 TsaE [Clostridiales bacterium]
MEFIAKTREDTIEVAKEFATKLQGGDVVLLSGELGAGKTTFTKGIALALGVTEPVTSPTFTIIKEYQGKELALYHMDMYRLSGDLTELGLEEYLGKKDGVCVIEWCAVEEIHARVFEISLAYCKEGRRIIIREEERA